jgi:GAF domain-containing protein/multidrug resistance efflux pump
MGVPGGDTRSVWRLAGELARATGEAQAAGALARAVGALLGAESVRVFVFDRRRGFRFAGAWPAEARVTGDGEPPDAAARAMAFDAAVATAAADAGFRSRLVLPLRASGRPFGVIELLERERADGAYATADADSAAEPLGAAEAALAAVRDRERVQQDTFEVIERLSRLYDIGRSFAATVELSELTEVIVNRTQAALDVEQAYLWILDGSGEVVRLVAAAGSAAESVAGWELRLPDGLVGAAFAGGEAMLATGAEEVPGLEERPDVTAGVQITSAAVVPVIDADGDLVGALEVVNRNNGEGIDAEDRAFLQEIAGTAAIALANARRLDAERRAADLGQLLSVSQQLVSHLDADTVSFSLVHKPAELLSFRRAAVGLLRGSRFELAAVSGQRFVDEKLDEIKGLRSIVEWAAGLDEGVYIVKEDDGSIDTSRPETREKFSAWFARTGNRSFLAVPLQDEDGKLGVWTLEADEAYAFSERDLEVAQLLGTQATVALRNAVLFQQMPMRGMMRPLARTHAKVAALGRHRLVWAGATVLAALALLFVPVPLRVAGDARVLPERRLPVSAETGGRIAQVLVREGDRVEAGQEIARLDDIEVQAALAEARAQQAMAERALTRRRAEGDAAGAAAEAARIAGLAADVARREDELERSRLRAREPGIVVTPRVEDRTGERLAPGEVFCEVANLDRQEIEIAVPERDAGLVRDPMPVKVRLYALPTTSVRAEVRRVGVQAVADPDGEKVFLVRAVLDGRPEGLRSGMTGRAKINTGAASLGRVIFRRPARWVWNRLWGWLP